ncbi:MAG: hypothetical protein UGF89_02515 [Acutalibacteraceae bacterium]|nr:hypothetical protein [Acutalibacteraceae bacterium]
MSYEALIHFKNIPANEVYSFMQTFKTEVLKKVDDIAKDNFVWLPSIRDSHLYKDVEERIIREIDKAWVHNVFKFRYFYLPKYELLGIFSVPDGFKDMFDNVTYFQNGCDQNYDFEEWNGVPLFEEIANKWKNVLSDKDVFELYRKKHGKWLKDEKFDYDYRRKSFCYDEIWSHISNFLFKDSDCVYLSLFGGYELREIYDFISKCKKHHEEWLKEIENDEKLAKRVAELKEVMGCTDTEDKK